MTRAPSAIEPSSDNSGSLHSHTSQNKVVQRFSSTSKFLNTIFHRLKSPFSPNSRPTPSTLSTPSPSPRTQRSAPREAYHSESNMAFTTDGLSNSRTRDANECLDSLDAADTAMTGCTKENQASSTATVNRPALQAQPADDDAAIGARSSAFHNHDASAFAGEKEIHQAFMDQALDMARLALRTNETPVGCVLVHEGTVVARGMNATNVTRNGTRHAEFMALSALLSHRPDKNENEAAVQLQAQVDERIKTDVQDDESELFPMDGNYVKSGHLYPYGQKLHHAPRVDRSIVRDCILYVTVEPCVMCAGLLRQLGIKKVYFGAVNDKFGGTGGVFSIHKNSTDFDHLNSGAVHSSVETSNHPDILPKSVECSSNNNHLTGNCQLLSGLGGDGGNVEPGFEAEGGWGRDEAVGLLRRFYVQENGRAPVPRKKEGRAARLAAIEQAGIETATSVVHSCSEAVASHEAGIVSTSNNLARHE
nr:tRNA-specific adenosine deaminase subunit TAD2 [Colletotrichum truncatum]KAF6788988.1 tRNA-specific adenosine deaminase subunit TAD2 [Colletotrichum truncatum]